MNEQKSIQYFVLVSGCFVPIVDNVVRDGAYLVDVDQVGDMAYSALGWWGAVYEPSGGGVWRLTLPVEKCGYFLRVESAAGDVTATVSFS